MLKLSTHIPIECIKQSEKLMDLDRDKAHLSTQAYILVITDIIDNAEELFGVDLFQRDDKAPSIMTFYAYASHKIVEMCQQNKSIEDISKYILKNII